eukprot:CAMPEP_0176402820 /NCGR_PEP_ID=MMETSP0126-20121128/49597_1 /TAXON_ID=141414 ORGANISM="Strombidinopsis acuminatum, Strain SPMC142" /NCGR_SAMPLE_ID=MMETSP0126 /ASSEMBLY_ACC=CAM_ASM_000229 /LENGTH=32 /DNA_ID= /DNA_START= /DNA_END= /DNA_ORIENTATION=
MAPPKNPTLDIYNNTDFDPYANAVDLCAKPIP